MIILYSASYCYLVLDDGKKFQYFGNCSLIVYKVYSVSESVNMANVHFIVDGEADSHA